MLTRSALVVGISAALAYQALTAPLAAPSLRDRLAQIAMTECATDDQCERHARRLGLDPLYVGMPSDALAVSCSAGDDVACRYLESE